MNPRIVLSFLCVLVMANCTSGHKADSGGGEKKNSPPAISSLKIIPASAGSMDSIKTEVTAEDPDGDPVQISYQWFRSGIPVPGLAGDGVPPGTFKRGETISVKAVPFDGKESGEPRVSEGVTIKNSPPKIVNISISPSHATVSDVLETHVEASDPDGDSVTLSYQWLKGDQKIPEAASPQLSCKPLKRGDLMAVIVTPSDGTATGLPVLSNQVQIQNSPPHITSPPPTAGIDKDGVYRYRIAAEDPDGDPLSYTLSKGPEGMGIDRSTGLIQWNPSPGQAGAHDVEVLVEDGNGGKTTQRYTLTVAFPGAQ